MCEADASVYRSTGKFLQQRKKKLDAWVMAKEAKEDAGVSITNISKRYKGKNCLHVHFATKEYYVQQSMFSTERRGARIEKVQKQNALCCCRRRFL